MWAGCLLAGSRPYLVTESQHRRRHRSGRLVLTGLVNAAVTVSGSNYPLPGANAWPNRHVDDLGEVFALALVKAPAGTALNAVGGSSTPMAVTEAIGSSSAGLAPWCWPRKRPAPWRRSPAGSPRPSVSAPAGVARCWSGADRTVDYRGHRIRLVPKPAAAYLITSGCRRRPTRYAAPPRPTPSTRGSRAATLRAWRSPRRIRRVAPSLASSTRAAGRPVGRGRCRAR